MRMNDKSAGEKENRAFGSHFDELQMPKLGDDEFLHHFLIKLMPLKHFSSFELIQIVEASSS